MAQQQIDAKYTKERIVKFLKEKGPELPVHIAKHVGLNTLFTSAFLSELASEGLIKISDMKVGGSPLYYVSENVALLENYFSSLGAKEREACILLKENKILRDDEQTPVIRVALRGLKDFAIPFKKEDKFFWKYFLAPIEEIKDEPKKEEKKEKIIKKERDSKLKPEILLTEEARQEQDKEKAKKVDENLNELGKINSELEQKKKELEELKKEIKQREVESNSSSKKSAKPKKKIEKKQDESFLNEIKAILARRGIELINIESFDKKQVFAKIKTNGNDYLLAAYNKKRIDEADLIKAYKKATASKLSYYVISKGETSKRTQESMEVYKKLASIENLGMGQEEVKNEEVGQSPKTQEQ